MERESPSRSVRWPILRVVPGHSTCVELLSGEWVRLATHYVGRTVLCAGGEDCGLCAIAGSRAFWYLPAVTSVGRRPCLLELSSVASSDLEQVAKFACAGVRAGCQFELSRKGAKSAIRSEFVGVAKGAKTVAIELWGTVLMAIFNLPCFRSEETLERYGERVRSMILSRSSMEAQRLQALVKR